MGEVISMQSRRDQKALLRLMADGKARDHQDIALAAGEGMGGAIDALFAQGKLIRTTYQGKASYTLRDAFLSADVIEARELKALEPRRYS